MKRRTKNLIAVIALTFMLGLSACESNGSNSKPTSLYSHGLEVVQIMSERTRHDTGEQRATTPGSVTAQTGKITKPLFRQPPDSAYGW